MGYPEGAIPRCWVSKGVQVASGDLKMQHILKHLTELTGERQQPFGTRLCLQSLVCYTLVPADAEKGLRANTASTCSVAEGCAGGHGSWRSPPIQRRLAEEPTVYVPLPAVATPFLRIIAMSRGLAPSSPLSFCQSSPYIFLQAAESIVFSKLFVDMARFLW